MNCPNCNKQLNPNQKFCDSCGFAIVPDPLNAKNTQRIFDTPNNNAPDAPGYGSGVYPSYQAAPAQPQYQEPYYAQPQPYGGGPQPPEKKNNMPLIIIIIVLAVLLAAGGIVTAILLLNNRGDKGSDPSSSAATSSKVSDSGSSKRDSDPSGENSMYYDALYYLGFAYYNAGNTEKADEVFTTFANKYPDSASIVSPYIGGGTGVQPQDTSGSQGAASMDESGTSAAGQGDITIYDNGGGSSAQVAWTDPTTGQQYDMYGNPIYSSGGGSSSQSAQIAWTDPNTGQGYDMYGNPVYQ